MSNKSHEAYIDLADFDRSLLPESQRALQGDDFQRAVQDYLSTEFMGKGGAAELVVTKDRIFIRWASSPNGKSLTEFGIDCLQEGDYEKGIMVLRLALQRDPTDSDALFNLGMALSDKGSLDEAVRFLKQSVTCNPSHAHGWVALGVAEARKKDDFSAIKSLRKAVELNPNDGHSHKNLGVLLARSGEANESLKHLRAATELLPSDPATWFNLAGKLEEAGELDDADAAYQKVVELDPTGSLSHRAETCRNRIAQSTFRDRGGNLRPDAFSYCLGALQRFEGMPKAEIQRITFEIAMLATRGLQVNDPAEQYTLNSLPGKFSGLHLLCIEYVGFKFVDPSVDIGFDLSAEYAAACKIHGK